MGAIWGLNLGDCVAEGGCAAGYVPVEVDGEEAVPEGAEEGGWGTC